MWALTNGWISHHIGLFNRLFRLTSKKTPKTVPPALCVGIPPVTKVWVLIHDNDVIVRAMASQIASLTIVYSTVYLGADQRKHQSSASLDFVVGIHRWPVNSLYKGPVTWKAFSFDDVSHEMSEYWDDEMSVWAIVMGNFLNLFFSQSKRPQDLYMIQGPISWIINWLFFPLLINFRFDYPFRSRLCTCHDSSAVVACANCFLI